MKTTQLSAGATALAALGILVAGLTGCSASVKVGSSGVPSVSPEDLQTKLAEQFAGATTPPQSIVCKDPLVGEVGKTASCEVTITDTNTIEAVSTVTKVDGTKIDFDISPALTKEQLAKAITGPDSPATVSCASGLEGKVGATAQCESTVDGMTDKRVVEVDDVSGLQMDFSVKRLVPKEQVGDLLMQKLAADGKPVETVECVDDVVAKTGTSVECATVTGGQKQGYVVTVTTVEENTFDIDYQDAP